MITMVEHTEGLGEDQEDPQDEVEGGKNCEGLRWLIHGAPRP